MAALATTHPTLLDVSKRLDPNGKIADIVEILSQTNEVLEDMVWIEGNMETGHRTTVRTGLPTVTWRKLYGGVQPSKSTTAQVTETCGMLEAYAEIDKALADLNNNSTEWRLSEETPFMEAMNQKFTTTLFYGNEGTEPEAFTGFAPRFNLTTAASGDNIVRAAASAPDNSDNCSIWLIVWGPNSCHGIYPKGSKAGIQHTDKGQVTIENIDGAGGRMEAYRSHYRWDVGLSVRDWRYVVRIQIEQEDLTKDAATGPDLPDLMAQAMELVPSLTSGRAAFYMNRRCRSFLRRQVASAVKNSTLTMQQVGGKTVMYFDEVPVRRVDALLNTETGVA